MRPNIVFYNPVSNGSGKRILPMSLLALGALLEGNYEYTLVDGNCEGDALTTLRARIAAGANLLAITVMPGPQLAWAVPHSRALKREFPHLQIVWGGYFPTQHSDVILQDPAVDFTVRGHGETVFLKPIAYRPQAPPARIAKRFAGAPAAYAPRLQSASS